MASKYPLVLNGNSIQELQSGDIIATQGLTTGSSSTVGEITGTWSLSSGSTLQSTYGADLAEWYTSDSNYEPGTVLIFGGDFETTVTNKLADIRAAGIVTENPAYVMNSNLSTDQNTICLALQGRVPCRVIGKISKGDMLTTSATPGYAIKAANPIIGSIIGKALANKDTVGAGVVEVAVGRL